jgi:hypothetical protein
MANWSFKTIASLVVTILFLILSIVTLVVSINQWGNLSNTYKVLCIFIAILFLIFAAGGAYFFWLNLRECPKIDVYSISVGSNLELSKMLLTTTKPNIDGVTPLVVSEKDGKIIVTDSSKNTYEVLLQSVSTTPTITGNVSIYWKPVVKDTSTGKLVINTDGVKTFNYIGCNNLGIDKDGNLYLNNEQLTLVPSSSSPTGPTGPTGTTRPMISLVSNDSNQLPGIDFHNLVKSYLKSYDHDENDESEN